MATHNLDGLTISNITNKEKEITSEQRPIKGGPTAQAQKHTGEEITGSTVSAIMEGEKKATGEPTPRAGGPTAYVQSLAAGKDDSATTETQHTGKIDSHLISTIANVENNMISQNPAATGPLPGGPTAQAQKHAGEPINSQTLHDITEGEKTITHQANAIKGGPTAVAQSELSKSRNQTSGPN